MGVVCGAILLFLTIWMNFIYKLFVLTNILAVQYAVSSFPWPWKSTVRGQLCAVVHPRARTHTHTRARGGALPPTVATPLPPMRHPRHQRLDLALGKAWGTQRHTRLDGHHLSPVQGHSGFFLCVLLWCQASLPTSGRTSKGMWALVGQGYGYGHSNNVLVSLAEGPPFHAATEGSRPEGPRV